MRYTASSKPYWHVALALAAAGYVQIARHDHRAHYPRAALCSELVFARASGCVVEREPSSVASRADGPWLFDPSRDWLAARGDEPCAEPEAGTRDKSQRCAPWNSSAPLQTGPTVYVERGNAKRAAAANGRA